MSPQMIEIMRKKDRVTVEHSYNRSATAGTPTNLCDEVVAWGA